MIILGTTNIPATVEVKGPDGIIFLIVISILFVLPVIYFLFRFLRRNRKQTINSAPLFGRKKISISLEKDRKYYPDFIKITIKNTGKKDVDLDHPMLIFRNISIG